MIEPTNDIPPPQTVFTFDTMGQLVIVPEEALIRYEGWGIGRYAGARLYGGGFTPEILSPLLDSKAKVIEDNVKAFANVRSDVSSIPDPKRRKQRRQLKPLKPWQQRKLSEVLDRIPLEK